MKERDARTGEHLGRLRSKRSRVVRRQLEALLRAGVESGELQRGTDVPTVAAEALAFMEGAQLLWLLDPRKHSLVGLYRSYFDRLIQTLSATTR